MAIEPYVDRRAAGHELAAHLQRYAGRSGAVVLGLARGGVPVASVVARALGLPMDVFVVRKLGVPGHEELAMGAIASGGVRVLNEGVVARSGVGDRDIDAVAEREGIELARRERTYRGDRGPLAVAGRTVIVVDDGLATGATMRAAVTALRKRRAGRIVVAVPVGAAQVCTALRDEVDEVICPHTPEPFDAVGYWYLDFRPTTDDDVRRLVTDDTAPSP